MIVILVLTIIILSVEASQDKNDTLISHLESKESFFYKINSNIHNAVNTIFDCLRLLKCFSKSDLNEMMLQIHNKFLNRAERNYIAYEQLRNATNTNFTMGGYKSKFLESLNEIVKEETIKHKHARNKTLNNEQNKTVAEKNDESLEFLEEFVDKFNRMTLENLTNHKIYESNKNGLVKLLIRSKNYELKVWNSPFPSGTPSNLTRRLYKGRNTRIKNYPFLVSIHILNDFMCSGSIISKDLVITAASCLQIAYSNSLNPQSVFVRVGSDYTKSYGQLIPVTDVFFHPQYNPQTLRNNIVIIRIKSQLNLVSKKGKIRRIQYNKRTEKQTDGVYVLGWGAQEINHNSNNFQMLAIDYLDIYDFNDCQEIYSRDYVKDHHNFCAGFVDKGAGACNRDVGGPGFRDGILIGIISFGSPVCGMPNSPTVFTNIGHYATWIDSIVHQKPVFKVSKKTTQQTRTTNAQMAQWRRLSRKLLYTTPFTTASTPKVNEDYPDEVTVLEGIIHEMVLSNSSLVDYILQSDMLNEQAPNTTKRYNNKNNFEDKKKFREFTRTTGMYSRKHTTENDETNMLRIGDNRDQLYDTKDDRKPDVNAHTPAEDVYKDEELRLVYSKEQKSSDVSDNYEEHPLREHEIVIDTSDIVLKNVSFLDVLFNLQQYQQSYFPKTMNKDKKETDPINLKFFLETEIGVDTTPVYLNERSIKIKTIEPGTEEKSYSDDDDDDNNNDGKLIREDNDNRLFYPIVDPWHLAFNQKMKQRSNQNNQYEFNFQREVYRSK